MAAFIGSIGEYCAGKEEWSQYAKRLDHFLAANSIADAKKKDVFLAVIGPPTYKLLKSLVASAKPGEKEYNQLVQVLTQHFEPAPSEIMRRYRFNSHIRRRGESVATYISELQGLAQFCNYGDSLETMLRDCLVCGINDESIQRRLLGESTLTFKKVFELAQGMETVSKDVREMLGPLQQPSAGQPPEEIHVVSKKIEFVCYRCGQVGHNPANCTFRTAQCHKCGKIGHIKKMCQSRKASRGGSTSNTRNSRQVPAQTRQNSNHKSVRAVQNETEGQTDEYPLHIVTSPAPTKPMMLEVTVNNQSVSMELDTGSAVSLVSEHTFKYKWPDTHLQISPVNYAHIPMNLYKS